MRVKFSGHNFSSFWFCPGDSFKLQMHTHTHTQKNKNKNKKNRRRGYFKNWSTNRWKQVYVLGKESLAPNYRSQGWGMEEREMARGGAARTHGPQYPHSSRTPRPCCSWRLRVQSKAGLRDPDVTAETRGSGSPWEGQVAIGDPELAPSSSSPDPSTPGNSPSRQAQEVQEGETDPEGHRDRGYLLGRNHLCNMPYFKPVQVSRLSRCPEQGARRGQRLSAACAHSRSHSPALTLARAQPAPAAVGACVCTRAGVADPAFPRPLLFSPSSLVYEELCIPLTLFLARTPKRPELTPGALIPKGWAEFFPTFNSWAWDRGCSLFSSSGAPAPSVSPPTAKLSLRFSLRWHLDLTPEALLSLGCRGPVCTHF